MEKEEMIKFAENYSRNEDEKNKIEYEFLDNSNFRKCKCGRKPLLYIIHRPNAGLSFEHVSVKCPICKIKGKLGSECVSLIPNSNNTFKTFPAALSALQEEWNDNLWNK